MGLRGFGQSWEPGPVTYTAGDPLGKRGGRSGSRSAWPKHCFEKLQGSVRCSEASTRKELALIKYMWEMPHPPLEIPNVCEHILGYETFCSKDLFSTAFHPACLQCIWWQNTVSKEHIFGKHWTQFFPNPRSWGFKHTIQMLLSTITATRCSPLDGTLEWDLLFIFDWFLFGHFWSLRFPCTGRVQISY